MFYTIAIGIFLGIIFLRYLNFFWQSRWLGLLIQWSFQLVGAFIFVIVVNLFSEDSRSVGILYLLGFIILFLLKAIRVWWVVLKMSESQDPIFSRFQESQWDYFPKGKFFSKLEKAFQKEGFRSTHCLDVKRITIDKSTSSKLFVYQQDDLQIQLRIFCWLNPVHPKNFHMTFQSVCADGSKIITSNALLLLAIDYLANYQVEHCFLKEKLQTLLVHHRKRIKGKELRTYPFEVDELNAQQKELETYHIKKGWFYPLSNSRENKQLTTEGCYRLWKQIIWTEYFGGFFKKNLLK